MSKKRMNTETQFERQKKSLFIIFGFIGLLTVILVVVALISTGLKESYYLKDVAVYQGTISTKESDAGKYYIKVNAISDNSIYVKDDNLWVEVNKEFYDSTALISKTGLLLGNYDVYKDTLFSGRKFEKSIWTIDEIYKSLEDANAANPKKTYTDTGVIQKKKAKDNGEKYFVVNYKERTFSLKVTDEIFAKYNEGSQVSCEFESVGDLIKLLKLK